MDHEEFPHAGVLFGEFVGGKEHRAILANRDDHGELGFQFFQNIVHMMPLESPHQPVTAAGVAVDDDHFMVIDQIDEIIDREDILQIHQHGGNGEFLLGGSHHQLMTDLLPLEISTQHSGEGGFTAGLSIVGDDDDFFHN